MPAQSRYWSRSLVAVDCLIAAAACLVVVVTLPITTIAAVVAQKLSTVRRNAFRMHEFPE